MSRADRRAVRLLATLVVVASAVGLASSVASGVTDDALVLIVTGVAAIVALVATNRRGTGRGRP